MSSLHNLVVLGTLFAIAGCAPISPLIVDEPIGPLKRILDDSGSRGSLIIYSETQPAPHDQPFDTPRSGYVLYTAEGKLLQTVNNRGGLFSGDPVTLELLVGQYKVTARAANFGFVTVSVVIQEGLTTVVDLNQEVLPRTLAANGDWVRLPNGRVIGSSAE